MISIRGRIVRLAGSALIASVGLTLAGAPAAHAATKKSLAINTTCLGFFINTDPSATIGETGGAVPPEKLFNLPITVAAVGGPTEVNAGSSFDGTAFSVPVPIPEFVDTGITGLGIGIDGNGVVPVHAAANITETIQVVGAASVGTPSFTGGGNVIGATVTKIGGDKIKVVYPGTKATSASDFPLPPANTQPINGDEHEFSAPSTFTTPSLKIPVTAGAAGSKIQFKLVASTNPHSSDFGNFQIDSDVDAFGTGDHIPIRAFCDPKGQLLGKVQVVSPPPPGAPNAIADVATTDQGKAVTVDVTANDTANAVLAMDKDSLAVTKGAAHGTTTVNADHTITYTPAAGFSGTDEFTYKLCSAPEAPTTTTTAEVILTSVAKAVTIPCDTAVVTVTVLEPQDTVEAPATTPTTLAAAAELPRTGSSSTPLALLGLGLCTAGLAAAGFAKSRRRSTVS
jgi:LPXTG-motif cell wall-anchored protein